MYVARIHEQQGTNVLKGRDILLPPGVPEGQVVKVVPRVRLVPEQYKYNIDKPVKNACYPSTAMALTWNRSSTKMIPFLRSAVRHTRAGITN